MKPMAASQQISEQGIGCALVATTTTPASWLATGGTSQRTGALKIVACTSCSKAVERDVQLEGTSNPTDIYTLYTCRLGPDGVLVPETLFCNHPVLSEPRTPSPKGPSPRLRATNMFGFSGGCKEFHKEEARRKETLAKDQLSNREQPRQAGP